MEPVSCTGFEKTGIFAEKIDFSQFKKRHQKAPRHFLIKDVFLYEKYSIWRNNGGSRLIASHSADKNTEYWKTNVRYTKWVSKYSSDFVSLEKYHDIPFSTTGFVKTGHNPQFLPKVKLKLWRHTQDLFFRSFLYLSWHYSIPSYKISNWYQLFKKSYRGFVYLKYRTCAPIVCMWISRPK